VRLALEAEWTKVRTVRGTAWALGLAVLLTGALGAVVTGVTSYPTAGSDLDATRLSLTGVILGQVVVAVLGSLALSTEYSTRMITVTMTATPRRTTVLAAKATVVGALTALAGAVASAVSLLAGRAILQANGITTAHGYAVGALTDATTLRAGFGTVAYLVCIALLALGVGAVVRDPAASIGVVLGLLFAFPVVASLIPNDDWARRVQQLGPMPAGLNVQATTALGDLPLQPGVGLGVTAAWASVALASGALVLMRRDT
jgi:ABC-2 type transport system permease protein